jgi:hypothetical protein
VILPASGKIVGISTDEIAGFAEQFCRMSFWLNRKGPTQIIAPAPKDFEAIS